MVAVVLMYNMNTLSVVLVRWLLIEAKRGSRVILLLKNVLAAVLLRIGVSGGTAAPAPGVLPYLAAVSKVISYLVLESFGKKHEIAQVPAQVHAQVEVANRSRKQCCCLHIKRFFLPNDISSTPSVLPDSSSYGEIQILWSQLRQKNQGSLYN